MILKFNWPFKVGFVVGVQSALKTPTHGFKICFDCYQTYGFPFAMHESGTIVHLDQFIWSGVVANLAVALTVSFLLGLIFKYVSGFFIKRSNSLP